jgi:hypothetical protein
MKEAIKLRCNDKLTTCKRISRSRCDASRWQRHVIAEAITSEARFSTFTSVTGGIAENKTHVFRFAPYQKNFVYSITFFLFFFLCVNL